MSKTQPKPEVIVPPAPDERDAKIAGLEMSLAAYQLERDAARKALDAALEEPCALCGKQRKDTP